MLMLLYAFSTVSALKCILPSISRHFITHHSSPHHSSLVISSFVYYTSSLVIHCSSFFIHLFTRRSSSRHSVITPRHSSFFIRHSSLHPSLHSSLVTHHFVTSFITRHSSVTSHAPSETYKDESARSWIYTLCCEHRHGQLVLSMA